jgi:hypothetical protein
VKLIVEAGRGIGSRKGKGFGEATPADGDF